MATTSSLFSRLTALPDALRARLGMAGKRLPVEQLQLTAEVGGDVIAIYSTAGMAAIRKEADAIDRAMLEQVASVEVKSWDEYLELRGRLWGFRQRQNIPNELIRTGLEAERTLEASQGNGR